MKNEQEKIDQSIEYLEENENIKLGNYKQNIKGLGDTLEKVFKMFGITEEMIKKVSGLKDCGCTKRKNFLNKIFPYRKK